MQIRGQLHTVHIITSLEQLQTQVLPGFTKRDAFLNPIRTVYWENFAPI